MPGSNRRSSIAVLLAVTLVVGGLIAGGVAGQIQPDETDTVDQESTFLRVAHVSPDAPPVDVYVDGEQVLSGVEFGNVSEYMTLSAGEHDVRVTPEDDNETTFFDGDVSLEPRKAMTLFAAGEVTGDADRPFDPVVYEDDALEPSENESAISVAHFSPDAPAVDVTADDGDVVLAENLTYGNASQYVSVPAGDYTVEVRLSAPDNDGPVVASTNLSLEGGTAYSAFAIGYVDSFDSSIAEGFRIELVEDATKTIHLPSEEVETETPEVEPPETETTEVATPTLQPDTETPATPAETGTAEAGTETETAEVETETEEEAAGTENETAGQTTTEAG